MTSCLSNIQINNQLNAKRNEGRFCMHKAEETVDYFAGYYQEISKTELDQS